MQEYPRCPFCLSEFASITQLTHHFIFDSCEANRGFLRRAIEEETLNPETPINVGSQNSTSIPQQTLINHDIV